MPRRDTIQCFTLFLERVIAVNLIAHVLVKEKFFIVDAVLVVDLLRLCGFV